MNRKSTVTHITPLPSYVSREAVLSILHDHSTIITLNPLVTHHGRCKPPPHALPDERSAAWYEITDQIEYLPGTKLSSSVTYTACMHDMPNGLQTHIYAPAGLEMRGKWQLLGWLPGEERDAFEISAEHNEILREGLYLREDCDLKCNILLLPFVKRNIHKSHQTLVEKLIESAGHLALQESLRLATERSYPASSASSFHSATEPASSRQEASSPDGLETSDMSFSQTSQFNKHQ